MAGIVDIKGVGPVLASACADAGFGSVDRIAGAKAIELAAVRGVGEMRAKALISAAQALLGDTAPTNGAKPKSAKPKKDKKKKKNDKKNSKKHNSNKKKKNKKKKK